LLCSAVGTQSTVTPVSRNNVLPDKGVTAVKHVGDLLIYIINIVLRQITIASVGG
jgi:hypothetical protein